MEIYNQVNSTQERPSSQDGKNIFASPVSSTQLGPKLLTITSNPKKTQEQYLEYQWGSPMEPSLTNPTSQSIVPTEENITPIKLINRHSFLKSIPLANDPSPGQPWTPSPSTDRKNIENPLEDAMENQQQSHNHLFKGGDQIISMTFSNPFIEYERMEPDPQLAHIPMAQITSQNPYSNQIMTYRSPTPPKPRIEPTAKSPYEYQWTPINPHQVNLNPNEFNDESSWQQAVKAAHDFPMENKPLDPGKNQWNGTMKKNTEAHVTQDVSMEEPDDSSSEYSSLLNFDDDLLGFKKNKIKEHMDVFLKMLQQYSDPFKKHREIMDHYSQFIEAYGGWSNVVQDIEEKYNISYKGKNPDEWMKNFKIKSCASILSGGPSPKKLSQQPFLHMKLDLEKFSKKYNQNQLLKKNNCPNEIKMGDINESNQETPMVQLKPTPLKINESNQETPMVQPTVQLLLKPTVQLLLKPVPIKINESNQETPMVQPTVQLLLKPTSIKITNNFNGQTLNDQIPNNHHGKGKYSMMGVPSMEPKHLKTNPMNEANNYPQNIIINHLYQNHSKNSKPLESPSLTLGQNFIYIDEDYKWNSASSSEAEKIILNCCENIAKKQYISEKIRKKISTNLNKIFPKYRYEFLGKSIKEIQQLVQKKRAIKNLIKKFKPRSITTTNMKGPIKHFQEDQLDSIADGNQGQQQWKKITGVGSKRKVLSMESSPKNIKRFKEDTNSR
jgi:hypothetical protein